MREIKFRGKAVWSFDKLDELNINHVNGWIHGNLVMCDDIPFIVVLSLEDDAYGYWVKVQLESVGQYTCLKDKNGFPIYEGDIIKGTYYDDLYKTKKEVICQVRWDKSGYWTFSGVSGAMNFSGGYLSNLQNKIVIGNVYENPELLEVEE